MAVKVAEHNTVNHNGVIYQAGELIHELTDEAKAELLKAGSVLLAEGEQALAQPVAPETPVQQAQQGGAQETVAANAAQDVADAQATAAAPGQPVGPVQGQPTPAEVAATAATVK